MPTSDKPTRYAPQLKQTMHGDPDVHTRYVVQKGMKFLSHRRSGGYRNGRGGRSYQEWDGFECARVWARETDARRAIPHNTEDAEVVPVTVALGKPFAVFTETP